MLEAHQVIEHLDQLLLQLSALKSNISATQNHLKRVRAQLAVAETPPEVAQLHNRVLAALDDPLMRELRETHDQ